MNTKEDIENINERLCELIKKFGQDVADLSSNIEVSYPRISISCVKDKIPEIGWTWKSDGTKVEQPLGDMYIKGPLDITLRIKYLK